MVKKSLKDIKIEKNQSSENSESSESLVSNLESKVRNSKKRISKKIETTAENFSSSKKSEIPVTQTKKSSGVYLLSNDKFFVLCNGKNIFSIRQLLDELIIMGDEIFNYHVNESKNDFANWIYYVFNDEELHDKIRDIKNKNDMIIILSYHILKNLERDEK